jgi:hypothetical protein
MKPLLRTLGLLLWLLAPCSLPPAQADTRAEVLADIEATLPTNGQRQITAAGLRSVLTNIANSAHNTETDGTAVVTGGTYANPAWLSSLHWSKITSTPTTLSGYGIADGQPLDQTLTGLADTTFDQLGQVAYVIAADTFATTTTTAFGRSLWDDPDAATARATLGLGDIQNIGSASGSDIYSLGAFACWGDSMSASTGGISYPRQLAASTRFIAYEGGVGGETSTQIKDRFLAATSLHGRNIVIWAGRNNYASPATVLADIAAMVAAIPHQRYLVLSIANSTSELSGSAGHTDILALNASLASTYGAHYFDIRGWLISNGLSDAGITPTSQDNTDIGNDVPPSSLRSDSLHLNTSGGGVVARKVARVFAAQIAPLLDPKNLTTQVFYDLLARAPENLIANPLELPVALSEASAPGSGLRVYASAEKTLSIRDTAQIARISLSSLGGARTFTLPNETGTVLVRQSSVANSGEESVRLLNTNTAGQMVHLIGESVASAINLQWRGSTAGDVGALRAGAGNIYTGGNGLRLLNTNSADIVIGSGSGLGFTPQYWFGTTGLRMGSSTGPRICWGTGTPEGSVSAPVGSTYHRSDGGAGTSYYVKESGTGNTGWVAK